MLKILLKPTYLGTNVNCQTSPPVPPTHQEGARTPTSSQFLPQLFVYQTPYMNGERAYQNVQLPDPPEL